MGLRPGRGARLCPICVVIGMAVGKGLRKGPFLIRFPANGRQAASYPSAAAAASAMAVALVMVHYTWASGPNAMTTASMRAAPEPTRQARRNRPRQNQAFCAPASSESLPRPPTHTRVMSGADDFVGAPRVARGTGHYVALRGLPYGGGDSPGDRRSGWGRHAGSAASGRSASPGAEVRRPGFHARLVTCVPGRGGRHGGDRSTRPRLRLVAAARGGA